MFSNYLKIILFLFAAANLTSCAPGLFFGAAGTGTVLSKEKTVGNSIDDFTIWSRIKAGLVAKGKHIDGILTSISVEVLQGRVLLTGIVNNQSDIVDIVKIVWDQKGVKEVINKIKLRAELSNDSSFTNDSMITAKIKSKMIIDKRIRSLNFEVQTIDRVVYIIGLARNIEELDTIKEIVASVPGIIKFENFIKFPTQQDIISDHDSSAKELNPEAPVDHNYDRTKQESFSNKESLNDSNQILDSINKNPVDGKIKQPEEVEEIDDPEIEIEQNNE